MRKFILSVLMTALFLLCAACSAPSAEDKASSIQAELSAAEKISMTANIRADYGKKVYDFKVSCEFSKSSGSITILEPENITGVSAKIEDGSVTLSFKGAEVYTGGILPDGSSPLDFLPISVNAWREGLITECVKEKYNDTEAVAVLYWLSDGVTLRTLFGEETSLPLISELILNDFTVITCTYENVTTQ